MLGEAFHLHFHECLVNRDIPQIPVSWVGTVDPGKVFHRSRVLKEEPWAAGEEPRTDWSEGELSFPWGLLHSLTRVVFGWFGVGNMHVCEHSRFPAMTSLLLGLLNKLSLAASYCWVFIPPPMTLSASVQMPEVHTDQRRCHALFSWRWW